MTDEYRVWFTRYGVRLYYAAESRDDADRWIRIQQNLGVVEIHYLELPDGTHLEVSDESSLIG